MRARIEKVDVLGWNKSNTPPRARLHRQRLLVALCQEAVAANPTDTATSAATDGAAPTRRDDLQTPNLSDRPIDHFLLFLLLLPVGPAPDTDDHPPATGGQ